MKQRFAPSGLLAIAADYLGAEFDRGMANGEPFERRGPFAVVSVSGPLMQHASLFWDSYDSIECRVRAALDSSCPVLLLKLCSPGGQVAGVFELAAWIRSAAAKAGKRVVAYVDGLAASAAYALACSADRIVVPPTGVVGSIGCIQVTVDTTAQDRALGLSFEMITSGARKTDGNPHVALSEDARAAMQVAVNDMAATFFETVGAARKMNVEAIASLEAGVFVGQKAVAAGLADEVMTLAELVANGPEQTNAAVRGAEANMNEDEKALKAKLRAIAEGDDKEAAARAKRALAAYEDDDGEKKDDEKKDDEKKDEAKAESEGEKDDDAKASAAAKPVLALIASFEERQERKELLASRPDFSPELVAVLAKAPIESVRDAVKNLKKEPPKSQVRDAMAAITTTPSVAAPAAEAEPTDLDIQMGLARGAKAIRFDQRTGRHYLGAMTPAEAKAEIARREAAQKGADR